MSHLAAVSLLAAGVCTFAQAGPSAGSLSSELAAVEQALDAEMRQTHTPGAAIAIVRGTDVVFMKGVGAASVETGEPVSPDTLFRLGSTTKMFTGLAAVLMSEAGELSLTEPVSRAAPDLQSPVGALTLDRLLSHTAGVIQEGAADGSHDDEALGRRVRGWTETHLFAPPGDVYSYSSPGYWLAGYAIEKAARKPFADVLSERIFAPLGMSRTTFRPLVALTFPMAQDHRVTAGAARVVRPYPDDVSTWPGGSMFSSVRDLARFAIAFLNEGMVDGKQVLSKSAIASMSTRRSDSPGGCGYTYGLSECTNGGVRTLSHYGFRSGSGSIVRFVPGKRLAVIILANRNGGILARTEQAVMRALAPPAPDAAGTKPDPLRTATAVEAARLAGRYVNGPDVLTLRASADGLVYRYGDAEEQPGKMAGADGIVVTDAGGRPQQHFGVIEGRITRDLYLTDGIAAFRRRNP